MSHRQIRHPFDFPLTAKREIEAAKRFFRKMRKDEPLLFPQKIDTDGEGNHPHNHRSLDEGRAAPC